MDFKDTLTLWTAIFNIIVISISGQIIIEDINSRASAGGRRPSLPSSTLSDRAPTYSFLTEDLSKAPPEPEVSSPAASKSSGINSGNFAIPSAQRRPNPFLQRLPSAAADQEALFRSKSRTNPQPSAPPADKPTFQNGQSGASATQPMYPNQPDPYQTGSFQGPFNSLNSNNNKPPTMAGPVPADRISYQPAPTNTFQSGYQQPVPGPQSMQVPNANSLPAGPGYSVQNQYGTQQSSQMYPPQQQLQDPQFATQYQSQSQYPQYSQPQQGMQQPMTLNSPAGPVQTPNFNDPSGKGYDAYGQPQSPYAPSPYDQQPQAQPAAYQQSQTGAYTQPGQPQQTGAYTQAGQPQSSAYTQPGQPQTGTYTQPGQPQAGAYQQQYADPNQQYQTQQQPQSQYPQYQQPANPAPQTQTYVDPNVPIPRMPGQQAQPQGAPAPAPATWNQTPVDAPAYVSYEYTQPQQNQAPAYSAQPSAGSPAYEYTAQQGAPAPYDYASQTVVQTVVQPQSYQQPGNYQAQTPIVYEQPIQSGSPVQTIYVQQPPAQQPVQQLQAQPPVVYQANPQVQVRYQYPQPAVAPVPAGPAYPTYPQAGAPYHQHAHGSHVHSHYPGQYHVHSAPTAAVIPTTTPAPTTTTAAAPAGEVEVEGPITTPAPITTTAVAVNLTAPFDPYDPFGGAPPLMDIAYDPAASGVYHEYPPLNFPPDIQALPPAIPAEFSLGALPPGDFPAFQGTPAGLAMGPGPPPPMDFLPPSPFDMGAAGGAVAGGAVGGGAYDFLPPPPPPPPGFGFPPDPSMMMTNPAMGQSPAPPPLAYPTSNQLPLTPAGTALELLPAAPTVYVPPPQSPAGYPPQSAPPGYPPQSAPPGYPPQSAPPGYAPGAPPIYPAAPQPYQYPQPPNQASVMPGTFAFQPFPGPPMVMPAAAPETTTVPPTTTPAGEIEIEGPVTTPATTTPIPTSTISPWRSQGGNAFVPYLGNRQQQFFQPPKTVSLQNAQSATINNMGPPPGQGQPPAPAAAQYPGYPPQTPPGYPPQAPPGYPPQTQYYDPSQPQQPYYGTPGQQPPQQYVQAPGAYPPQQAATYPAQQQPAATYPGQQQPAATYPAQQQPAATYQQQQPSYPQQQYPAQPPAQPGYPPQQSQQQVYQQPGYPPQPGYPQQQPQAGGYQPQRLAYPQPQAQQQQQYPFSSPAAKFPGNNPYGQQSVQYPQAGQAYTPQGQPSYPPPGPPGQQAYTPQGQQAYTPQGQQSYSPQGQQTQNQMPMRGKAQIQELLSKIKQAQIHSVSSTKTAEEKNKWNAIFRKLWDIYLYWSNLKPGNKASNSRGMMKA